MNPSLPFVSSVSHPESFRMRDHDQLQALTTPELKKTKTNWKQQNRIEYNRIGGNRTETKREGGWQKRGGGGGGGGCWWCRRHATFEFFAPVASPSHSRCYFLLKKFPLFLFFCFQVIVAIQVLTFSCGSRIILFVDCWVFVEVQGLGDSLFRFERNGVVDWSWFSMV